jgi:hypothetical protein
MMSFWGEANVPQGLYQPDAEEFFPLCHGPAMAQHTILTLSDGSRVNFALQLFAVVVWYGFFSFLFSHNLFPFVSSTRTILFFRAITVNDLVPLGFLGWLF